MRAKFEKTILKNGRCVLSIVTPMDQANNASGDQLLPNGASMDIKEITQLLLYMLSEAYNSGHKSATYEVIDAVLGLLEDNKQYQKLKPKISLTVDYRE